MGLDLETRPAFDGVKKGVMVKGLHKGSKAEVGGDPLMNPLMHPLMHPLLHSFSSTGPARGWRRAGEHQRHAL
jgi:hypothetical protein